MIRKTILSPYEMPDSEFFQPDITIEKLRKLANDTHQPDKERRIATLFCQLASLTKRLVNEGVAFEDLLSAGGMENVSKAIYALEWRQIYYDAIAARREFKKRGYWQRLWDALRNKRSWL